jgi:hypothetical protein
MSSGVSVAFVPFSAPATVLGSNSVDGNVLAALPWVVEGSSDPPVVPPHMVPKRGGGRVGPMKREGSASGSCRQLAKLVSPPAVLGLHHVDVPMQDQGVLLMGYNCTMFPLLREQLFLVLDRLV